MTLEQILPYILPPLLGALIGYLTNYVAIRMLFRPLRPWRLFGIRVPMTPGIIPAKRQELARRMGEMVGAHLLTPGDVGRALETPGFRRELKLALSEKLGAFLDRQLGAPISLVPAPYQARFSELVDIVAERLASAINDYLQSEAFAVSLEGFTRNQADRLLALDLEQCVTPEQYDAARGHLDDLVGGYLGSGTLAEALGGYIDNSSARWLRSDKPVRALIPAELVAIVLDQIEKELPPLLERFAGLLYDPDFRQRLIKKMREGIESFLDSLGGLAGLLSGFVDLDRIYAKLPETLDKASEEISRWLREEKTRAEIAGMVRERLENGLDRPVSSYVEKLPYEKVDGIRQFLRQQLVAAVQSRKTTEALLRLADRGVDSVRTRSFASLIDRLLPDGGRERTLDGLAAKILALLRGEQVAAGVRRVSQQQLRYLLCERQLGRLAARLPSDINEELEEMLYLQLVELLKKEIPVLVDALNVRKMVEDKVNSLDLLEVEGLLLGVMQEQFKYINLFGALLGFLIGLLNLLLLRLPAF